jgi:hypothetical protein
MIDQTGNTHRPVLGGLGLPIELREYKSVCKKDYIITTTGFDLVVVDSWDRWWFTVMDVRGDFHVINLRYTGNRTVFKRIALANLYGHVCMRCGAVPDELDTLTLDHVIPRADNGWGSLSNLQLLCKDCNVTKADSYDDYRFMTPSEIFWCWVEDYNKRERNR